MRTFHLKGKIATAVLSLSLLFGMGVALSTEAQAQWRNDSYRRQQREYEREQRRRQREYERQQRRAQRQQQRGVYDNYGYRNDGYAYGRRTRDGYGNYGGSFDLRQTALNAGYNEGMKEGREDRSRGERFNFTDEGDYREADKDYSSRLGDRSTYQAYFRQAFQNGYRDGYNGNTGYNSGGYYDPYNY
jgi:multidrug efflux pump subunit AcrA (membrane-fusion protein)